MLKGELTLLCRRYYEYYRHPENLCTELPFFVLCALTLTKATAMRRRTITRGYSIVIFSSGFQRGVFEMWYISGMKLLQRIHPEKEKRISYWKQWNDAWAVEFFPYFSAETQNSSMHQELSMNSSDVTFLFKFSSYAMNSLIERL